MKAGPPVKKKLKTNEEKILRAKEYEMHCDGKFQSIWQTRFKWLLYDSNHKKMYCTTCRSVFGPVGSKPPNTISSRFLKLLAGPFVVGSSNFKKDVLNGHKFSDGHIFAVEQQRIKCKPLEEAPGRQIIKTMNRSAFDKHGFLLLNAHALAIKKRPFSDYEWMCALDKTKGLDIGQTYLNVKSCLVFVKAIA